MSGGHGYIEALLGVGTLVGFLSGLLGKGGSAVTTPILQVFLHVPDYLALASPLPSALPTLLAAAWAYRGRGLVDERVVKSCALWGFPATIAGSFLSARVSGPALMVMSALLIAGLGVSLVFEGEPPQGGGPPPTAWKVAAIAIFVGGLSGLLANSGGVLFGPLFISVLRLPTKTAIACSMIVAAILAVPGLAVHVYLGHVDWTIVVALSVAAIPSSYLGARLALRLRDKTLLRVYGALLSLFGLYDVWFSLRGH